MGEILLSPTLRLSGRPDRWSYVCWFHDLQDDSGANSKLQVLQDYRPGIVDENQRLDDFRASKRCA